MKNLLVLIALFFISMTFFWFYGCDYIYYGVLRKVKRELNKIEGVEIVKIDGNHDVTLEEIHAELKLSTGDTIFLYDLTMDSFKPGGGRHMVLYFNQWWFYETGCYSNVDSRLGFPAEYSANVHSKLNSVQNLIKNIDVFKALIDSLPTYPRFDTLKNKQGKTYYFQKYSTRQFPNARSLMGIPCVD